MLSLISQLAINKAVQNNEPLYLLVFHRQDEIRYEFLNHSFKCQRIVICGGNAGMAYPSEFGGDKRGVLLDFMDYGWKLVEVQSMG